MTRRLTIVVDDPTIGASPRLRMSAIMLAVGVLSTSLGRAQAPQATLPQATVRELATLEGDVDLFLRLPSGRALIYSVEDGALDTFAYEVPTKRRTLLGTNMVPLDVSPLGDRLAFKRPLEDGVGNFLWTMPMDPETGAATGEAQRVGLRPIAGAGMFTPDGRMLVFIVGPLPDGTWDVVLVPATGGAERVVANHPERVRLGWSADGKSLLHVPRYVSAAGPRAAIERIPVAGGRSEPLVPRPLFAYQEALGLSSDARAAFFHANPDRFFYRTASGVEGEISVPLPPLDNGWGGDLTLDSTMRCLTMTQDRNERVRVLDVSTGDARDLLPLNTQSSSPAWSPDGRRIAVLTGNLSHYDITVVNADGSSPRHYPVPMHLDGWFGQSADDQVWVRPWSPDGRFLAFRANLAKEGQKVGWSHEDQHQIGLLDVDSGETRVLTTSSSSIGRFMWRSDGNAVMALERTVAPMGLPSRWTIVEIPLNGPKRAVRDLSAEFPDVKYVDFLSDRAVLVTVTVAETTRWFLVPFDGGAARQLPGPRPEPGFHVRTGWFGQAAGTRMLFAQLDDRGEEELINVVSTVDDSTLTLRLPFSNPLSVVFPDGKQLASIGKATGDLMRELLLVPLDGSAPRLVGEIPFDLSSSGVRLAPSPDSQWLAYTASEGRTSKILEIDFAPALEAITQR